jgi:uncharacterized protein YneF (UPF0154 family)
MEDVYILSIVFGFAAFVCTGVYKLISKKLNQNDEINPETFERLARAFMQHQKEMEKRVQNLEAIIADDDDGMGNRYPQIEEPKEESKLTNDLRKKDKVRS